MSGWRLRSSGMIGAVAALFALAGCSGGSRQDEGEPTGNFPVSVTATFPTGQRMSEHTHMVITVRNAGSKPVPNLAVTICNISCQPSREKSAGTGSAVFSENVNQPTGGAPSLSGPVDNVHQSGLANPSRPAWIVDQGPGKCVGADGDNCREGGGAAADVTSYANTWAFGHPLKPGESATFDWSVTAVMPGSHVIAYEVAAGLNGIAHAVAQGGPTPCGNIPCGTFHVTISRQTQNSYVTDGGQIVNTP